jgi:hypothetical protein
MSMRKIHRELKKSFPFAIIEITGGEHIRLRLPNGESVFCGSTPSDQRALMNLRATVRRKMSVKPVSKEE